MTARNELERILAEVQRNARETLVELAQEGRRIGARTEHELKDMIVEARATGRERLIALGGELEKLGKNVKKLARGTGRKAVPRKAVKRPHVEHVAH
jgi:hypothetical protein